MNHLKPVLIIVVNMASYIIIGVMNRIFINMDFLYND